MQMNRSLKYFILTGIVFTTCAAFLTLDQNSEVRKTFVDPRDGQTYPVVKLGNIYWFASNLNYNSIKSECYEDKQISCGEWGRLYPITEFRNVCPDGWRLPNKTDWKILEEIIAKEGVHALYLGHNWKNNEDASNSTGLSLVPSGFKHKKKFLHQYLNSTIWFNDITKEGSNWHFHTDGKNNVEEYYFHTHEEEVYDRKFAVRCVCESQEFEK